MSKEFIWTDELVKEFANNLYIEPVINNQHLSKFKKSKEVKPIQEYTILSMLTPNHFRHTPDYSNHGCKENHCSIFSVQRLSDNTIWDVGENTSKGIIKAFNLKEGFLEVEVGDEKTLLRTLSKATERIPLFTTEDGLKVFSDTTLSLWRVFTEPSSYEMWKPYLLGKPQYINIGEKFFHKLEAAKEYVIMNKPCLSLNDLLNAWDRGSIQEYMFPDFQKYKTAPLYKNFEKLAKEKLKL